MLQESLAAARDRCSPALARRFGIDARALAAFRVALGCILLFDAVHRSRDLVAFYADAGVLPRAVLREETVRGAYSLHALSGEPRVQLLLLGCTAVLALALIVGYRTRLVALLSLVLVVSIHFRNPYVLNSGDRLFRELLLLALFLPLGSRWALDARSRPGSAEPNGSGRFDAETADRIATPATAAVLVHVVALFFTNAMHKLEGGTWLAGDALGYALRQDHLTILLGDHLSNYPLVLEVGTYVWLGLLLGSPLLLAVTGRLRTGYVAAFLGAVVGMSLSMAVGLFPPLLAASLLLFLPARCWDAVEAGAATLRERVPFAERVRTRWPGNPARAPRPRPARSLLPRPAAIRRFRRRLRPVVATCVLLVVVAWSIGLLGLADPLGPVDSVSADDHQWEMFAPDPSTSYGWYTVAADLENGERVDVLQGSELRTGPPPDASETVPSFRWRRYASTLGESDDRDAAFAAYTCRRADERFDAAVESVTVTYTYRPIELEDAEDSGAPDDTSVVLERRTCSG